MARHPIYGGWILVGLGFAFALSPWALLVARAFAGNRFRCPLTGLAERYGAERGSVTDIYLPKWFAHNMPAIHAPLLMLMAYLHARNLMRPRSAAPQTDPQTGRLP